ncbi:unnamed protein product [Rotaria sordida]|uniref:Uncharacterized protein n=1 Tax=Rotaria sordida TaxID=392033 RepID=A0A819BQ23_9BILA|nr:unnamed protein product [Rotaria sordida]
MQTLILILLIVLPQLCTPLNCYSCSGTTGCNEPFNSLGSGVSTTGTIAANTYCILNYASCNHLTKNHIVQGFSENDGCGIKLTPCCVK